MNIHVLHPPRPAAATAAAIDHESDHESGLRHWRQWAEAEVDRLIGLMDALDGDPDFEASSYAYDSESGNCIGVDADLEHDDADAEPSLGSLGGTAAGLYWPGRAQAWAGGSVEDCEIDVGDEGEPDYASRIPRGQGL